MVKEFKEIHNSLTEKEKNIIEILYKHNYYITINKIRDLLVMECINKNNISLKKKEKEANNVFIKKAKKYLASKGHHIQSIDLVKPTLELFGKWKIVNFRKKNNKYLYGLSINFRNHIKLNKHKS